MEGTYHVPSKVGKETFIFNGFEYYTHRVNNEGIKFWCCCKARSIKCKANLVSDGMKVIRINVADHNHESNVARVLARKAVGKMKTTISNIQAGCSAMQGMISPRSRSHGPTAKKFSWTGSPW